MTKAGAMRPHWGPFIGLVALVVAVDQISKVWITTQLSGGRTIEFLNGNLRLIYTRNDGALFGLFRGQVLVFALLSLGVIALILAIHARSGRSPYMSLTLGLLLGGAIGNALDRFRLGYVVDFVDGGLGTARFFTFNLADACISGAIILLFAMAIWPAVAGQNKDRQSDGHAADQQVDGQAAGSTHDADPGGEVAGPGATRDEASGTDG